MSQEVSVMQWASALSTKASLEEALRECGQALSHQLSAQPDAAFLFLTPHYARDYALAPRFLERSLAPRHLLGCSAAGVIGDRREVERRQAVSVLAACLPGVRVDPFHLTTEEFPDMDAAPKAWADMVGVSDRSLRPGFIVLADPFTFNPENLARGLDYAFPGSVHVGGLASAAMRPGHNVLYLDGACLRTGAVGLALTGNLALDPLVAQGCRPIGKPMRITLCEENYLLELDGQPAVSALESLLEGLAPEDQELARTSLFIGLVSDPLKPGNSKRSYLIRNLLGIDPERGILAVGAMLRPGQTVRFHLRDSRASAQDLDELLKAYARKKPDPPPAGALLFSCMGRGRHLYGVDDHDTTAFLQAVGAPVAGFFCNGEIGPVEGSTHLHGYTSCFGIFRPAR